MKRLGSDFEFVSKVCERFFRKAMIRKKLEQFSAFSISDFEKWLQIEIELFCLEEDSVSICLREYPFQLDQRKAEKIACRVDLLIQQKGKQSPIAIELKQKSDPSSCYKNMIMDYRKLSKVRKSENGLRSLFLLGLHDIDDRRQEYITGEIKDYLDDADIEKVSIAKPNRSIGNTGLAYSLFGIKSRVAK